MEENVEQERGGVIRWLGRAVWTTTMLAAAGFVVGASIAAAKRPRTRKRARAFADAAGRAWAHPERIAATKPRTLPRLFVEAAGVAAAKTVATRLASEVVRRGMREPGPVADGPVADLSASPPPEAASPSHP